MNTPSWRATPAYLGVAAALLLCSVAQGGTANDASRSQTWQSQAAAQQTNGRGAVGVNCKPEANGCRIQRITKSSPAEGAGLRVGDLLLRLNPSDSANVVEQIAKNAPGTKITLPFQRGTEHMQVAITVEDQLAIARRGAALGDATAEEALGSIYRNGVGVPKNAAEALKWYRKAAEQGLDTADYAIGRMYDQGEGVPKDDGAAVEWYRKAAEQGHAPAEYLLGQMYSEGRGVTKDDKAAAEWFRKAADQGNVLAEYNLGWSYENGRGVPKDLKAALDWYTKAAAQGFEPAKEKLAKVHP